jgi:recombination protein RecR
LKQESMIDQLIEAFRCLPGVGPKTAQRMVYHLLQRDPNGGKKLALQLTATLDSVSQCRQCRNLTELDVCELCSHPARQGNMLCVVESPADVIALEMTGGYKGHYFVLMGTLSPLDGVGPAELGLELLKTRCGDGISEVILAIGSTVEGEATCHYITESIRPMGVTVSRLAQGIPFGGDLEYMDGGTLIHALEGRKQIV